jgi:ferredoxin
VDTAVSICLLKRYAADHDLSNKLPFTPEISSRNGKKIGIIGTGPAGLSAAYFLLQKGYECVLYDKNSEAGGALRYAIPEERLPGVVLDEEIEIIKKLGAVFKMNYELKEDGLDELTREFDSVVIATGEDDATFIGLNKKNKSFVTDRNTHSTSEKGIFAIGSAIKPGRVAIRAVAHGKEVAYSVDQYLNNQPVVGEVRMFNSRFGKMMDEEVPEYMLEANDRPRIETDTGRGFSPEEVKKEAERCMRCDCRKQDNCKLRIYSDQYRAAQKRYFPSEREPVRKIFKNKPVVYEPEKCIKCGICVWITSRQKEKLGLTYIGKGFDVEVSVPFDNKNINALEKTAQLCAKKCPTGALAINNDEKL